MITVVYVRKGLHVVAYNVNDSGTVYIGLGFTRRGALKHLIESIESDAV